MRKLAVKWLHRNENAGEELVSRVSEAYPEKFELMRTYLDDDALAAAVIAVLEMKRNWTLGSVFADLGYLASSKVAPDKHGRQIMNLAANSLFENRPLEFEEIIEESLRRYREKGWEPLHCENAARRYAIKHLIKKYYNKV